MPSTEAPIELHVVPSSVEPSSIAPSPVVPSFLEDIPQVSMGTACDSKPPVTRVYTRTRRIAKPPYDEPSPIVEPSSSVPPSPLDEPSFFVVPSIPDETVSDAGSARYALHVWQSIRHPDRLGFAGTVLFEPTSNRDAIHY